jgi:hypothetical protein
MTWRNLVRLTLALLLASVAALPQAPDTATQPPPEATTPANAPAPAPAPVTPAPSAPKHLLFGGTVSQLDAHHITVSRTLPGKNPEHRTFLINAKTRMSRAIKLRSLVTVRYRHLPEGDVALEVQLRPLMKAPRAS